jgi:ferredoxin
MSVTVHVSSQLVPVVGKDEVVLKEKPRTVGDAIDQLSGKHPELRDRLMTRGEMREWVKIWLDDKEIFEDLAGLDTRLPDGTKLRIEVPGKARVTFVQENRIVEVEPGRTIKEIALELGIDPNRKYQRLISCEGLGIFDGCKCWVRASSKRALNGKSWTERALHDLRGWQRLACQARVFGDVEVWTMPQGDERLREPRPIASPPPQPKKRERYLESIFRTPAADDEEGDAETKPAAKKSPTDTKAKVAAGAAPGAVPVDTKAAAAAVAATAIPAATQATLDAQNAKPKSEPPAAAKPAPVATAIVTPIVTPIVPDEARPSSEDAKPNENERATKPNASTSAPPEAKAETKTEATTEAKSETKTETEKKADEPS